MDFLNIFNIVFFDFFKTDNQVLNLILLSIIGYILKNANTQKIREYWTRFYGYQTVIISQNNHLSYAIVWYIQNNSFPLKGCFVNEDKDNNISFLIGQNIQTKFVFNKETFYLTYVVERSKPSEKTGQIMTTKCEYLCSFHGHRNDFFKEFFQDISKKYKLHVDQNFSPCISYIDPNSTSNWENYNCKLTMDFDNLILDSNTRKLLKDDVLEFVSAEKEYAKKGLSWNRGYLFHGVPGCGKTSLIKAMVNETKRRIYYFDLNNVYSDDQLRSLFRDVSFNSILVFEDIDCLTDIVNKRRKKDEEDEKVETKDKKEKYKHPSFTLSCLLNELDGLNSGHGRIIVMTTNHKEKLDEALIRPGRIDFSMELKKANREQIVECCRIYKGIELKVDEIPVSYHEMYTVAEMCNLVNSGYDFTRKKNNLLPISYLVADFRVPYFRYLDWKYE
jgi:hypothetical protein